MNNRGQTTLAFLFACILILGATGILSTFAIALTVVEQIQYVAFSASRNYFAAQANENDQQQAANRKIQQLLTSMPILAAGIKNGWVKVNPRNPANFRAYAEDGGADVDDATNRSVGIQIQVELPLLKIQLPLVSDIIEPPGGVFSTNINSFLLREPTFGECQEFFKSAYPALRILNAGYSPVSVPNQQDIVAIYDNGC